MDACDDDAQDQDPARTDRARGARARARCRRALDEALQPPRDHRRRRRGLRQVDAPRGLGPAPRRRLVHARRARTRRSRRSAAAWSTRCACACPTCPSTSRRRRAPARGPDASADEAARADAFAAALSEALQERLRRPLALVLDDLHALAPGGAAMRAVEALCRQAPEALHVVLVSRAEPAVLDRPAARSGPGPRARGADLAFDADEVRAVLAAELDGDARELGATLHTVTEGWPAAVRLACEAMRALPPAQRGARGRAPAPARRRAVRLPGARGAGAGAAARARAGARGRAAGARRSRAVRRAGGRGGARSARLARAPRAVRREPVRSTAGSRPRA